MLYLPCPGKVPVSFLLHWRCLWHLCHPRGGPCGISVTLEVSTLPWRVPCGTSITLEVSVPQLQHPMGSLQHLCHPGDVPAVSPLPWGGLCSISTTLEMPVLHFHHPMGVHEASPPLWRCPHQVSTTMGRVHMLSPSPPWCPRSMSPSPLGGPSPAADAGPPGDLSSTHNVGWAPTLLVPPPPTQL